MYFWVKQMLWWTCVCCTACWTDMRASQHVSLREQDVRIRRGARHASVTAGASQPGTEIRGWMTDGTSSRERNLTKSSLSALPPKVRPDVRGAREHIKRGSGVKYRQTDTEEITSNMNQRSELQLQPYTKTRFILRAVRLWITRSAHFPYTPSYNQRRRT